MIGLVPVRPDPFPGEDLYSLAFRTASANQIPPATLGLTPATHTRRSADPTVLAQLGTALGLSRATARAMTLDIYPRAVAGRAGKQLVRTWRLPGVRWECPRCTPASGIYLRDWQLALHPLCVTCPSLLRRQHGQDAIFLPVPDRRAIATQRRIADVLATSRHDRRSLKHLRDLYRLVTLVALTADDEWPLLVGWEAELREGLENRSDDWTKYPSEDPADAAVIVLECARALADRQPRRSLVHEGWERLRAHPVYRSHGRATDWAGMLPSLRADGPSDGIAVWQRETWDAYRALAKRLTELQSATGLRPEHIPGWDLRPGEVFAPEDESRAWRTEIAVTAHMLLSGPVHNKETEHLSRIALGITGSGWSTRRLALGRGITPQNAHDIESLARRLIAEGLVDYAERRRHLMTAHDLIPQLAQLVQGFGLNPPAAETLETWAWVSFTGGPAWDAWLLEPALDLDQQLDPEQRLLLRDVVLTHLAEATRPTVHLAPEPVVDADSGTEHVGEVVA